MKKNSPKGKLKAEAAVRRDHIEDANLALYQMLRDIDEVILRMNQAMQRTAVVDDVLSPAVRRLGEIRSHLRKAQNELGEAWLDGQARRWFGG